jgi:phage/plasmid-like protein (TIGR03299 family)
MPAAVETYQEMAAFASLREPAWHGLGTVFDKPVKTEKMLSLAHLDNWNLRFVNAEEVMPGYSFVTETQHVVRDNPFVKGQKDVLGTVGGRYRIFDNESIFDFGDSLTDGRRRWETAGSLNGGRTVFATLVSTDDLVLDPNGSADTITRYLMLTSSHDGSSTMIAKKVNTRVVCQNTLNVALGEKGDEFRIRHTQGMDTKLEDAKLALGFAEQYDAIFEAEAKAMIESTLTKDKFFNLVKDIFPEPEVNVRGSKTKWETKTADLMWLWENGTKTVENIPDSPWKAVQVLTEHNQWFRQIRSGNTENFLAAGAGFDNVTNATRNMLWQKSFALVPAKKRKELASV